jgi:hypothetical protein
MHFRKLILNIPHTPVFASPYSFIEAAVSAAQCSDQLRVYGLTRSRVDGSAKTREIQEKRKWPQPFVLSDARESRARPVSLTTISEHAAHCPAVGGGGVGSRAAAARAIVRAAVERVVARPSARDSRSVSPEGHLCDRAYASSLASIVICAFSTFETGHPALALFAAVSKAC